MADITLINMNLMYGRLGETVDTEKYLPLGLLYLTSVLEQDFEVQFIDYQFAPQDNLFTIDNFLSYVRPESKIVGFSCMGNLLPFSLLCAEKIKDIYTDITVVFGGVGVTPIAAALMKQFDFIDVIFRGEGEKSFLP